MLRKEPKQMSFHSELYNKIPENHMLKKVSRVVNFSFINELLEETYCKNFGRPAKEPEMMCKLLFLQYIYNVSDEKMESEGNLNLKVKCLALNFHQELNFLTFGRLPFISTLLKADSNLSTNIYISR